jgi:hypothetical protein
MLHRIDGRASYFSPDIFIERCKDTKNISILRVLSNPLTKL